MTSALFTQRPPFPHSNFDAFYNPAPPLAPSLSQPPQNPHGFSPTTHLRLYSSTFLRFCKLTEKKKTSDKQPQHTTSLSPAYYLPPALFTKRPPFPHSNFDAFYNPAPPLAPSLSQPPQNPHGFSPTTHPSHYSYTFLRFCKFTEKKKTSDKQPQHTTSLLQAYSLTSAFSNRDQHKMKKIIHALLPSREAMA